MDIEDWRKRIDEIDEEIVELLNRRAKAVLEIGKLKDKNRGEYYAPHREKEVYDRILSQSRGPFPRDGLIAVYREIMSASLSLERSLRVAYLGPPATFTHLASRKKFGSSVEHIPQNTIADIFEEVESGRCDYGVVPIENSTEGVVSHTLDMFITSNLMICSEIALEIEHNLLSNGSLHSIRKVYSHPQAIGQCRRWLRENLPGSEIIEVSSTARAAEMAAGDPSAAAIASALAGEIYGLNILQNHIEDNKANVTRFLVVGKHHSQPTGNDKTSILFTVKNRVGALHDVLAIFAKHNIDLTKIESRPSRQKLWEYVFFVDAKGHPTEEGMRKALAELEEQCIWVKVLGAYPASEAIDPTCRRPSPPSTAL
ncbi:MAG: prephenate dehydratase [bacterium]